MHSHTATATAAVTADLIERARCCALPVAHSCLIPLVGIPLVVPSTSWSAFSSASLVSMHEHSREVQQQADAQSACWMAAIRVRRIQSFLAHTHQTREAGGWAVPLVQQIRLANKSGYLRIGSVHTFSNRSTLAASAWSTHSAFRSRWTEPSLRHADAR